LEKFKKQWFGSYKIQYYPFNNIVLLINIGKFERNPILVNINKFKPYRYLGKVLEGLEATIEGGGEHKEDSKHKDSQKDFQDGFNKNQFTLKTTFNQKIRLMALEN
jgi:hypothetical protein